MKLRTLLILQAIFAAMALAFLFTSAWYLNTTGKGLSAAAIVPSIAMFVVYSACLLLPRFGALGWYRIAMAVAIVLFGVGGVVLNVVNYVQNGLRDFASFEVFLIAVAINAFGTIWNIVAAVGAFERPTG